MPRWYEAFLLIYLLLSTLEFAYQHQLAYAAETVGTVSSQLGTIISTIIMTIVEYIRRRRLRYKELPCRMGILSGDTDNTF